MEVLNKFVNKGKISINNLAQELSKEYDFISNLTSSFNKFKNDTQDKDVADVKDNKIKMKPVTVPVINGNKNSTNSFNKLRNDGSSIGKRKREITIEIGKLKRGNSGRMSKAQVKNRTMKLRKELSVISKGLVKEKKQQKQVIKQESEATEGTGTAINTITNSQKKPNNETKLVFNKFKFNNEEKTRWSENKKNDINETLTKVLDEKKRITKYEEKGKTDKAAKILQGNAWNNAFKKAEGQKVKDDPTKLKMMLQRKKGEKLRSQKKWENRESAKKHSADDAQEKRKSNIQAQKQRNFERKITKRQGTKTKSKSNKKPAKKTTK